MNKYVSFALILFAVLTGCKKECGYSNSCFNSGTWDNVNCKCNCPANYSGDNCEDYTPPCSNKGDVTIYSGKSDPYEVRINGIYRGNVGAYGQAKYSVTSGSMSIEVTQASGYIFYPSVYTGSGYVAPCGAYTWSF